MEGKDIFGLDGPRVWDTELAYEHLQTQGKADTKRTAERRLHELGILPAELGVEKLVDELDRCANQLILNWAIEDALSKRKLVLFAQLATLPNGHNCLHANDARGGSLLASPPWAAG